MDAKTAWVKKPYHTKGLDPLGAQAPCINIYGQLLPGITNVTDRARYYSFYPWVVWTFDKFSNDRSETAFVEWVRRADCLFTLISVRHRLVSEDNDHLRHDAGLVGSVTLRPVVTELGSGQSRRLSEFTGLENHNKQRYFKNPLGGLKQYYIGTFDELGLMKRDGRNVAYTEQGGQPMAEAFDVAVNGSRFIEIIQNDDFTTEDLDALAEFCPCALSSSRFEHERLVSLFFDRDDIFGDDGKQRKHTLGLLLDLITKYRQIEEPLNPVPNHSSLRACVYSGYLPNGEPWEIEPALEQIRSGWSVYQRNELLSVAVQSVFEVALACLEDEGLPIFTIDDFYQWFADSSWCKSAADHLKAISFDELVLSTSQEMPNLSDWKKDDHEIELANTLLTHKNTDDKVISLSNAARIIATLVVRDKGSSIEPYAPMEFPPGYFSYYPVNLSSLRKLSQSQWIAMPANRWLAWIAAYWAIDTHLKVALRKLRNQSQDTFHVIPTDHGLKPVIIPRPTYTNPRLTQATQILQDIGAIQRTSDGNQMDVTDLGEELRRFAIA